MSKGLQTFTDNDLKRVIKRAKDEGAVSVDIVPKNREVFYRINLYEDNSNKKQMEYNWGIGNKEQDIIL